MKNLSGFRSKMLRAQIFIIYKNFESIKCRDFVTELHFAVVKLHEEKKNLSSQIKMTLSRLKGWEILRLVEKYVQRSVISWLDS